MSNNNTGGPAFPTGTGVTSYNPGMTLRDYFAAKGMQGEISRTGYYQSEDFMLIAAKRAYAMADAMLKARGV